MVIRQRSLDLPSHQNLLDTFLFWKQDLAFFILETGSNVAHTALNFWFSCSYIPCAGVPRCAAVPG